MKFIRKREIKTNKQIKNYLNGSPSYNYIQNTGKRGTAFIYKMSITTSEA